MRKLKILKALVDFIWFIWCLPMVVLLLLFTVLLFTGSDSVVAFLELDKSELDTTDIKVKIFLFLFFIMVFVCIYCFYLFRKTLRYFQRVKPFHVEVIANFYEIGYLLAICGVVASILIPVSRLVIEHRIKLSLGVTPYLGLACLGLFFMILSEVFKVAKHAKEENELTV